MGKYSVLTKEDLEDRNPKTQGYDFSKMTEEQMDYCIEKIVEVLEILKDMKIDME